MNTRTLSRPSRTLALAALAGVGLHVLSGCGGSNVGHADSASGVGGATLTIAWPEPSRLIPAASNSITVAFFDGTGIIRSQQTVARPANGGQTTLNFRRLPAGTYTIQASAYPTTDGTGVAQARAQRPVIVSAGSTAQAAVTMNSTIVSLAISPTVPTVPIGKTVTLVPTALDASGAAVLVAPSTLSFASSDPSVATVTAGGVLTGIKAGTTTITLTEAESGISTTATATIADSTGSAVVDLANAYISSLSTAQQGVTVVPGTAANVARWSNLAATPSGTLGTNSLRNGVSFSTLTSAQRTAFLNLAQAALGTQGYARFTAIRAADAYLGTLNSAYSGDFQYLAFVGTPSTTGTWTLQIGGHQFAANLTYTGGTLQTTTPYALSSEPPSYTSGGTTSAPLKDQRDAAAALVGSLTTNQLSTANLGSSFSDLLLGPGKDARSNFPTGTSGRGVLASTLTDAQRELLRAAISAWTKDSPLASAYDSLYGSQLSQTYVAYSGTTAVSAAGDYVRIDGPNVWIEFLVSTGGVVSGGTRYRTVLRDRVSDYNTAYSF